MTRVLNINFGTKTNKEPFICDLYKISNLLISGRLGTGCSTLLHSIIESLANNFSDKECEFVIIDPTGVMLDKWYSLPHCKRMIRLDVSPKYLQHQCQEIRHKQQRLNNIPRIIIISELGEFMSQHPQETTEYIKYISEHGPDVNIYIIVATQRPDNTVLSNQIRQIFKAKISLQANDASASMRQLEIDGAQHLINQRDALFYMPGSTPIRFLSRNISDLDIARTVYNSYCKSTNDATELEYCFLNKWLEQVNKS